MSCPFLHNPSDQVEISSKGLHTCGWRSKGIPPPRSMISKATSVQGLLPSQVRPISIFKNHCELETSKSRSFANQIGFCNLYQFVGNSLCSCAPRLHRSPLGHLRFITSDADLQWLRIPGSSRCLVMLLKSGRVWWSRTATKPQGASKGHQCEYIEGPGAWKMKKTVLDDSAWS